MARPSRKSSLLAPRDWPMARHLGGKNLGSSSSAMVAGLKPMPAHNAPKPRTGADLGEKHETTFRLCGVLHMRHVAITANGSETISILRAASREGEPQPSRAVSPRRRDRRSDGIKQDLLS